LRKKCEHEALPRRRFVSENRRIQAKKSHFSAFSVDGSVELLVVKRVKEYFRERIEKNSIFAGFDQQELVGLIGFYRHSVRKINTKALSGACT
jgi:hypothetical protein